MDNDYTDLFDLYLNDIEDGTAIPQEFILSSKVIFLSNAKTIPSKVKPHTLSFTISTTEEEALNEVNTSVKNLLSKVLEKEVESNIQEISMEDLRHLKGAKGSLEDLLKVIAIRSSGLPEDLAQKWFVSQD